MRETNFCHFPLADGLAATVIPAVDSGSATMMGRGQEGHGCSGAGDLERGAKTGMVLGGLVCVRWGKRLLWTRQTPGQVPLDRLNMYWTCRRSPVRRK
jgi:hypothetical protein